ncbi:MAG: endonuclease/exonuclease/phosphatase family protein [Bacteroidota bacterium]
MGHKILLFTTAMLFLNASIDRFRRIPLPSFEKNQKEISLLSYNLFFKNGYKSQIIQEIKQTKADVVFLQELTPGWNQSLSSSVYPAYPYQKTYLNKGTRGLAILSKFPIVQYELVKTSRGIPFAQYCVVKVKGEKLVLVNGHLTSPAVAVENPDHFYSLYRENAIHRQQQWDKLSHKLQDLNIERQIIGGDLNTMPYEPLYRQIRHEWRDLFKAKGKGWGATFPNVARIPLPMIKLDYIMFRGKIRPLESRVLQGSSSDHLAIWGKVSI